MYKEFVTYLKYKKFSDTPLVYAYLHLLNLSYIYLFLPNWLKLYTKAKNSTKDRVFVGNN